ncbi:MAG: hypothetical protein ACOX3T_07310 [Bdellovibrionota bacterium]
MDKKKKVPFVATLLVACLALFATSQVQVCVAQGNSPKNVGPVFNFNPTEPKEELFIPSWSFVEKMEFNERTNWDLFRNMLGYKLSERTLDVNMSLERKLNLLEKYTLAFQGKVNDISVIGKKRAGTRVTNNCNSINKDFTEPVLEFVRSTKLELSKKSDKKLLTDRKFLAKVATAKYKCVLADLVFPKLKELAKKEKNDELLKAISEAKDELDKMLASCESFCFQAASYHLELLGIPKAALQNQDFAIELRDAEFHIITREERNNNIAKNQAILDARVRAEANNGNEVAP